MSTNKSRYNKCLKIGCITVFISGAAWIIHQIKTTKNILNNAMDLTILNTVDKENINKKQVLNVQCEYIDLKTRRDNESLNLWYSLKFKLAERLMGLCIHDNEFVRTKALLSLGKITNLDNGHFSLLSNMIDEQTAVRLARVKDVDLRLFKEPPVKFLKYDHQMIINEVKELLLNLSELSKHSCLEYSISKAFFNTEDSSDSDTAPVEMAKLGRNGQDLLPICLESLLHHASTEPFGKDIVEANALPLLSEIHNRFRDDINVNVTLCRIISYLSFHKEVLEDLHNTGWIRILAEWMKHDDVRISIPAAKALINLEKSKECYRRHLYPLYPSFVKNKDHKIDVIFVHGLLGGVFFTWRQRIKSDVTVGLLGKGVTSYNKKQEESLSQTLHVPGVKRKKKNKLKSSDPNTMQYIKDFEEEDINEIKDFDVVLDDIPVAGNCTSHCGYSCSPEKLASYEENDNFTFCWPRDWLPEDCDNLRIIGVNYNTTLSTWNTFCPLVAGRTNIEVQSSKLLESLLLAGVGSKPIVWVTHSMGGLLVKNILCKAFYSPDPEIKQLVNNTRGIVFYSTPHLGSNLANFNPASQLALRLSIEVQDLREDSPFLRDIHDGFLKILEGGSIRVLTFVETKRTIFTAFKFSFQLVTPESGNTGFGEYYEIPLDHLGICKPVSRFSFLYRKVLDFIHEIEQSV